MEFGAIFVLVLCSTLSLLVAALAQSPSKLGHYNVDASSISVSGLSSGGYFTVQFHVAFSEVIMGAGVIAGGPFWCAQSNINIALTSCTKKPELISVKELVDITYSTALTHTIDSPHNMKNHPVYLFSGTLDTEVLPGVMKKLEEYYSHFTDNVTTEFTIPAEHAMPTDSYGNKCSYDGTPYINNCQYSTAYHILQHIYKDIKPYSGSPSGNSTNLFLFDQREFFTLPAAVSMDTIGFVYVPENCQKGRLCRLHIVFHGCKQGRYYLSDTYALHAGYNGLAEENNLIVLYPQVTRSDPDIPTLVNPMGCWDWWGYTGEDYASKLGLQMVGVKQMLNRIVNGDLSQCLDDACDNHS